MKDGYYWYIPSEEDEDRGFSAQSRPGHPAYRKPGHSRTIDREAVELE